LIVYLHPRDIDPHQPRLPLSMLRSFKCYVNLNTAHQKLAWLLGRYDFGTMLELVTDRLKHAGSGSNGLYVLDMALASGESPRTPKAGESFRERIGWRAKQWLFPAPQRTMLEFLGQLTA
jgi:hypothetical protein